MTPPTPSTVTVIVPAYREAESLPPLLERIAAVRERERLALDVLVMDNDSGDGTAAALAALGYDWVELVVRRDPRGLSGAVVEGMRRARGEVLVVIDADLSHPPEKIPELLRAVGPGRVAVGSRYAEGGSTDEAWSAWRAFKSRVATWLARPLSSLRDPMAGYFALRRTDVSLEVLRPIGFKILLEVIVRCDIDDVIEVPIHFRDRERGASKLTLGTELTFLWHLRRLYGHKLRGAVASFGSRTKSGRSPSR